ncbi:copper amine oxidase N-terminal domain-containing protein [Paenibacillus allorhizoplanae]
MKKTWMITASCIVATSLMAGSAFAKSENSNSADKANGSKTDVEINVNVNGSTDATVTSDTYGQGKNGYKGLLNALENVKNKPAGAVIADLLLTNYGAHISAELKAELDLITDRDAALAAVADVLDEQGSVTDAVYVQKEAVKVNLKNINSYKKLTKLYHKLGKKGVFLYVNGEQPSLEVNPFIKDGSTLVPFRAISEALKAEVKWDAEERSVTVTRDGVSVKLFIDSTKALVDGKEVILEVPATIVEGNTVVPVRFISESLKATVKWEDETQSVVIYEEE